MNTPAIGGKVLDASAVAALLRGRISAFTWFGVARDIGIVLYLPSLVLAEVGAVRPESGSALVELVADPVVVLGELDAPSAAAVDALLDRAHMFDALAGHAVHVARRRGWPVLTDDPGRVRRLDPALEVDLL